MNHRFVEFQCPRKMLDFIFIFYTLYYIGKMNKIIILTYWHVAKNQAFCLLLSQKQDDFSEHIF